MRGGLEQFAGVKMVPFSFVAILIVIYIAFIGPIDYVLVKKVFRRTELTWRKRRWRCMEPTST